jgi:hypothetical protein
MRSPGAIAVAGLVAALALAGCGGGGGGGSASSGAIVAAAAKTARAGSVEADFTVSGSGLSGFGSGVFNTGESRSGQLSMKVAVGGRQVPIDTIVSGNALYMRSPVFSQVVKLPPGKEWVKLDLGRLAQQRGIDLSSLASASPTPTSALAYLRGSGSVKKVGSESIHGVSTTHYRVNVDLEKAAAQSSGSTRKSLQNVITTTGVKTFPVEVWIDGKSYIRKVTYTQGSGGGRSVKVTMELHDFGKPVEVKPPPSSSVLDILKLQGGGQ